MADKEVIIASLREEISHLDNVSQSMGNMKDVVGELIGELEDESRLGTPADYDYGAKKLKEMKKMISKGVKKNIKILNDFMELIESLQFKASKNVAAENEEFERE